jgi:DNA/RNA-binding domain of Phe-tRNA-synthetase-like protein
LHLKIDPKLKTRFSGLKVLSLLIKGVKVERRCPELERFAERIVDEMKGRYKLDALKDVPTFRAYRDFFWQVDIDPTKSRPAAEALIRRVLAGKQLPRINSLVDTYNLASIKTEIALAAFDVDKLHGDLYMRFATEGEEFVGIGMQKPTRLKGGEVVISDKERIVALYPHRDSDCSKVTEETSKVLLLMCGVPGIGERALLEASRVALEYVTIFCGGNAESGGQLV